MPFVAHRVFGWGPVEIDESWGLKTIKPGHAYSICNSLECNNCRCIFLDIRFDDLEMKKLYEDYRGHSYVKLREFYEPGYINRNIELISGIPYIDQVEYFIKKYSNSFDSILDWGGDTGKNTPFRHAKKRHVYDLSPRKMVEGVEFIDIERALAETYDLIVCSNVLEHTPYPSDILLEISQCANPNTTIYIEVPKEKIFEISKVNPLESKRHWHEHINFFTEESIIELCKLCGLEVIAINEEKLRGVTGEPTIYQVACSILPGPGNLACFK